MAVWPIHHIKALFCSFLVFWHESCADIQWRGSGFVQLKELWWSEKGEWRKGVVTRWWYVRRNMVFIYEWASISLHCGECWVVGICIKLGSCVGTTPTNAIKNHVQNVSSAMIHWADSYFFRQKSPFLYLSFPHLYPPFHALLLLHILFHLRNRIIYI